VAFVYKMMLLLKAAKRIFSDGGRHENDPEDESIIKTKHLIIKLTILACVSVTSSILCWVLYAIIGTAGVMIDVIISCFCLILSFNTYNSFYLFCCWPCRNCCK